jgi:ArsR family transcriptional regulator
MTSTCLARVGSALLYRTFDPFGGSDAGQTVASISMTVDMDAAHGLTGGRTGPECCPSGLGAPIDRPTAEELGGLLKAVADPARLQILALLRSLPNYETCVCDLTEPLGLSQPTVSHHLKVLAKAGLVASEKRGYWTWYRVLPTRLGELSAVLA